MGVKMMNRTACLFLGLLFISFVSGVEILDALLTRREKECYGTNMGFSFSGTYEFHYEAMRRRFTGCTYVHGNLEVTNLIHPNVTFDLSFLSTIKVVTGYVLLGLLNTEVIPLTSLKLIRADTTMRVGNRRYGLIVVLTAPATPNPDNPNSGLKELRMPALREITRGNILFMRNPRLCYVDTIDWSLIGPGRLEMETEAHSHECGECHAHCADSEGVRRCWGSGKHMCQKLNGIKCDSSCHRRCFSEGKGGCCHRSCAVGCYGNLDTECEVCKHFRYGHKCVSQCPRNTYSMAQDCIRF